MWSQLANICIIFNGHKGVIPVTSGSIEVYRKMACWLELCKHFTIKFMDSVTNLNKKINNNMTKIYKIKSWSYYVDRWAWRFTVRCKISFKTERWWQRKCPCGGFKTGLQIPMVNTVATSIFYIARDFFGCYGNISTLRSVKNIGGARWKKNLLTKMH